MKIAKITSIEKPVLSEVCVPGSKSYSLRALVIRALCENSFKIENLLDSSDTDAMNRCVYALRSNGTSIDADESGLSARFTTALACISPGSQIINGQPSLRKRPIKDLVDALRQLGAEIEYTGKEDFLPLKVKSSELTDRKVNLKGDISSQYLSALLLIAPILKNGLVINIKDQQVSKPYIDITIDIMKHFGVIVENQNYKRYLVKPQKYMARDYSIEVDYSSASYFYAIQALTGSKIMVRNLNSESRQGDKKFCDLISEGLDSLSSHQNAVDFPDQAMTLAVLLAFKPCKSTISGIKSLRIKETERVKAIENELAKMGIKTESTEHSLTIYGGNPKPASIDTYGDHRMAMAFAVAATRLKKLSIYNPEVVNKTFPGFWNELQKITPVEIKELIYSNIILTGMRGTGKSTVGRIIAKKLKMKFVDVDKFIEKQNSINIKKTVQKKGWDYFRTLESETIEKLSGRKNTLISTGAGAILSDKNVQRLRTDSLVFMLKAEPKILASRISRYNKLPALTRHESVYYELDEVWNDRKAKYYTSCDFIIETENLSPEDVAQQIIAKL